MLERGKDKEIEGDYMISLKDTGLFRKVAPAEIQKMMKCSGAVTKEYKAGDYIFREEDMPQFLYLILEGEVSIVKDFNSGRQDILYVAGIGDVFGEDFFGPEQKPYWFNAVANTKTMILLLPWRFFFGFCSNACEHHQQLIRNMLEIMAVRNFDMTKKAHILSSTTLREKISVWLLETMEDGVADTGMNREQMAAYLGVTRPSLSREMMKMQKEGIISVKKGKIFVSDRDKLYGCME